MLEHLVAVELAGQVGPELDFGPKGTIKKSGLRKRYIDYPYV